MNYISNRIVFVALLLTSAPATSFAHHSVAGFFDPNTTVEIEGIVTRATWRNPHTLFEIDVTEANGEVTAWHIESGALGILRARGLGHEFLKVGDHIKARGDASRRGRNEMFAHNMLLSNGEEVVITVSSSAYFSLQDNTAVYAPVYDEEVERLARENADGIFRVWSTNLEERPSSGSKMMHGNYAITEEARAIRDKWDAGDEALQECNLWQMPRIMGNPLPIAFERRGSDIELRFEEDDHRRLIYMDIDHADAPDGNTFMGYSTGHWEGDTLVVETTHIAGSRLDNHGTPITSAIHLRERFTPADDGSRLEYLVTITDPNTFITPVETGRYWLWRPEIIVEGYSCNEEDRFAESN